MSTGHSRIEISMVVATAVATLAAAIIAGIALYNSIRAQDSLNQQETQQNASKVYLGEAPKYAYTYAYDKHFVSDPNGNEVVWVVMNASDVQIGDTWIKGKNGMWDYMNNVQGCSLYALPHGFDPVAVYFSDSYGQWRRTVGAGPELSSFNPPYKAKLKLEGKLWGSPWWVDVPYCP